jgi:hypothetical protein
MLNSVNIKVKGCRAARRAGKLYPGLENCQAKHLGIGGETKTHAAGHADHQVYRRIW